MGLYGSAAEVYYKRTERSGIGKRESDDGLGCLCLLVLTKQHTKSPSSVSRFPFP